MRMSVIFAVFSLLLLGCNKGTNFHVKIINPATGEGYANHQFYIKSSKTGSDGQIVKTEYTGYTDQNGEAIVPLKIKKSIAHYVTPSVVPNTCYINSIDLYYNNSSDPNPQFIFEIAPCAQLKLNIQNVNCEGPNDLLNFKNKYNYTEWGSGWSTDRLGCYTYESPEYFNVPEGWRIYQWRVIRPSGTIIYIDSIYLNAGQNHTFEMFY